MVLFKKKLQLQRLSHIHSLHQMVRTECQLCGKRMFIQALRSHTKKNHEVSISDYKEKFRFELVFHWIKFYLNLLTKRRNIMVCLIKVTIDNVHRVDILEKVYHQCGICGELMLHDKYDSFSEFSSIILLSTFLSFVYLFHLLIPSILIRS